jgi:hypothetical protein
MTEVSPQDHLDLMLKECGEFLHYVVSFLYLFPYCKAIAYQLAHMLVYHTGLRSLCNI